MEAMGRGVHSASEYPLRAAVAAALSNGSAKAPPFPAICRERGRVDFRTMENSGLFRAVAQRNSPNIFDRMPVDCRNRMNIMTGAIYRIMTR